MKKYETHWAPINSAIAVVMTTAAMSAFIDWSYSGVALPEEGMVEAVDAALADSMHDQNLVCTKPGPMVDAGHVDP